MRRRVTNIEDAKEREYEIKCTQERSPPWPFLPSPMVRIFNVASEAARRGLGVVKAAVCRGSEGWKR